MSSASSQVLAFEVVEGLSVCYGEAAEPGDR